VGNFLLSDLKKKLQLAAAVYSTQVITLTNPHRACARGRWQRISKVTALQRLKQARTGRRWFLMIWDDCDDIVTISVLFWEKVKNLCRLRAPLGHTPFFSSHDGKS